MFQQSSSRSSHSKGSKVKQVLQIGLLLIVVVWLLNHINKNEYAGGDQINLVQEEDVDFGRKGKAGSENVIIIDSQKRDLDETPETSEAGDQADAFGQHTEEKNEDESSSKEQEESQEISNTDGTETQEEQLGSKDDNDDSSTNNRDVAISNGMSKDKEDVLQLPSQRDRENSLDQNEEGNVNTNSMQQNELVTIDGAKNYTGEAINSDKERFLSSEGGEKTDEVEKEAIDSHGRVKLETESSSDDSLEVEKEANDSHGVTETESSGENSLEDTTTNEISDDASLSLPKEENGVPTNKESSEKNTLDSQGDISTDANTAEHQTLETVTSDTKTEDKAVNLPSSTEEKESRMPTNNEVPQREAFESQDNSHLNAEATGDNTSLEETNTESDDEHTVTSVTDDTKNVELPVINEALERDAVDSHGDNASDARGNDVEEEKIDLKSNEGAPESKGDDTSESQNAGNNFSSGASSETNSADEAKNSFQNNVSNLEVTTEEASNVGAAESQGDNFSKEDNTSNTVFEDTTELKLKEQTTSELGNNNDLSGGNDNADSWKESGKDSE